MSPLFATITSITGGTTLLLIAALLFSLVLAFEIWMFIDVFSNPKLTQQSRILWAIGMLLLHPFVAIVYFFMYFLPKQRNSEQG